MDDSKFSSPLADLLERVFSPMTREVIAGNIALDLILFVADRTGVSLDGSDHSMPATAVLKVLQIIARAAGISLYGTDDRRGHLKDGSLSAENMHNFINDGAFAPRYAEFLLVFTNVCLFQVLFHGVK